MGFAKIKTGVGAWLALSRLPFHTVGVLPFILGLVLARHLHGIFRPVISAGGIGGVVLVMLAAYYGGEYWDWEEDSISEPSPFAGGSKVLQSGRLKRRTALAASIVSAVLALAVGAILQFIYGTGPWTIPFGLIGLLGGFFYSAKPIRWVSRGVGELWIAFCYGWLPVAASFYLQTGRLVSIVHWMAVPIGLSIFNVILLNEFLDYAADRKTAKANLVVRLGLPGAAILYGMVSASGWAGMALSVWQGVSGMTLLYYIPVFLLSVVLVFSVLRGCWEKRQTLERLCGFNMAVNIGTTGVFIIAVSF